MHKKWAKNPIKKALNNQNNQKMFCQSKLQLTTKQSHLSNESIKSFPDSFLRLAFCPVWFKPTRTF